MKFSIYKCTNDTVPGIVCKSEEEIEEYISNIYLSIAGI